ncbi:MAG: phosphoribosylanthranilate isomerase [Armatimonadetes bacterium]|nr:phosphoribosylanthranilate isomerase [Armatimonadota bacterium]
MTRVKICGLTRVADVEAAVEAGAHALGFVFEPASPRFVGARPGAPAALGAVPPLVASVAVFGRLPKARPSGALRCGAVQFTEGSPAGDEWPLMRIRAVRLHPGISVEEALGAEGSALLLDTYDPNVMGGTGMPLDWDLAAEIVRGSERRVILAGGLTPENVAEAVRRVRPYAVDVSSGVEESPGVKDHAKIRAFVEAVRSADSGG